jgi:predicted nucleic acid-binding protein
MVDVNVAKRLTLVSLTPTEIAAALKTAASVGARGGAIYDVLLLAAARKCGADRIHTLNYRHFAAFAPDLRDRLHDGHTSR